ncbi:MAG: hypothetical protein F6K50_32850 [Moorea sp. SIO3I7]|uniref:hypothetical protein n=1 Tax=Moorena sp. SIO3I8 TaxID=2607833 RepID=UPI0013C0F773|nr:hypothetical protein [Moorena sp. SIO3I8]NEO00086.1 hypothetical protein [Moorena sp. SIO3I7]NEO04888.1 hypothetical protein [Moorena sp. SIO3I8]
MPTNALCKLHYLSGALPTLHETWVSVIVVAPTYFPSSGWLSGDFEFRAFESTTRSNRYRE